MTPEQRTLRARLAAHAMRAQGKTNTAPARAAQWEKYLDEVDPHLTLPEDERIRRAQHARIAFMTRIAFNKSRSTDGQQLKILT